MQNKEIFLIPYPDNGYQEISLLEKVHYNLVTYVHVRWTCEL